MATATETTTPAAPTVLHIGPEDHGRRLTLDAFVHADFEEGYLYELSRGVVDVTEIPGIHHGRIVFRLTRLFLLYGEAHPGVINYQAGGMECRLRLPGMASDRHPDQAIYLDPPPPGDQPWTRWSPHIVVEVVSKGGEERDFGLKREEYLLAGAREYWILDPKSRSLYVFTREGDTWVEAVVAEGARHRTPLLPGLEVDVSELLGPPEA
jgi:Uma2 family endonuclease